MKPLFLNPPTFEDFDGGAGARYQASREVTSFWYPTWLCFPAGMIEGSRVVDAPVQKFTLEDCLAIAKDFDMVVMYTSTPTLMIDIETARRIKAVKPGKLQAELIKPVFLDEKNGNYKVISFYAKKARGLMSRFIIKERLTQPKQLEEFCLEGYQYDASRSQGNELVFTRPEQ